MSLQDVSAKSLNWRKMLLKWIIRENKNDPRIDEPKRQLKVIEEEIERRANEPVDVESSLKPLEETIPDKSEERPLDLVVGLKTLKIKGTNKLGG
jgi:hypothetical protein